MREFEFRFWDSKDKTMVYSSPLELIEMTNYLNKKDLVFGRCIIGNITEKYRTRNIKEKEKINRRFKIMQFTGFMLNKFVYEGDILCYKEGKHIEYHAVQWQSSGFKVAGQSLDTLNLSYWTVAGNIFEDKELLMKRRKKTCRQKWT